MIKIQSAHIEEVRGIRKLDIIFGQSTFAISGPNGSGKSGVIDAIEFALTGNIGRLTGRGTKGLTVAEHGPHIDKIKFPDAAFVTLEVYLPLLGKSATITRKVSGPKKPVISPPDDDIKAAFAAVADHPEITLSRREILRFILTEPTKRSEEIQALLKLDDIGDLRSAFNTAQNRLQNAHRLALGQAETAQQALKTHLQLDKLEKVPVLAAINARRKVLAIEELADIGPQMRADQDLSAAQSTQTFNKVSVLADLKALDSFAKDFPKLAQAEAAAILAALADLESDPGLLTALQRRDFIEKGLSFIDSSDCPLCDKPWEDEAHLRAHIKEKLAKSEKAGKLRSTLLNNGTGISKEAARIIASLKTLKRNADAVKDETTAQLANDWTADLESLKTQLNTADAIIGLKDRLTTGWLAIPSTFSARQQALTKTIEAIPDQTATLNAQTFLTTTQVRLQDYRMASATTKAASVAAKAGKAAYDAYCQALQTELDALYDEVQKDFASYYREINEDDESTFTAKLVPSEGKVDLSVNFFERGLFPPGAYHSEGHQDSMGVCLYLALMKRLFGDQFSLALLDDVVMSVDSDHRYQFCKLLKTTFPHTQFIITTHDRVWAEQMKSAGVVTSRTSLAFHSWSVDTGPLVESNTEIWLDIDTALAKGKVDVAASALRRHIEFVARLLADQLGAQATFRADGNYELGDLFPAALKRMKDLCGKAAAAAQSWGYTTERDRASKHKEALSTAAGEWSPENWAVNKAVHYNEWANFSKKDFTPIVNAYKILLACFRCDACDSWLYVTPRGAPESLRCACNAVTFNLKEKPK